MTVEKTILRDDQKDNVLKWRQETKCILNITGDDCFSHDYKDDKLCGMIGDLIEDSEVLIKCHEEALDVIFENINAKTMVPATGGRESVKRSRRVDTADDAAPHTSVFGDP